MKPVLRTRPKIGDVIEITLGAGFGYLHVKAQTVSSTSHVKTILTRYASGERSFAAEDLDNEVHDFAGANLSAADFSGCFILGSFRGANLQRACFTNANVKTCDFTGANLKDASFDGAIFKEAILSGASFAGASDQGHVYGGNEFPLANAL